MKTKLLVIFGALSAQIVFVSAQRRIDVVVGGFNGTPFITFTPNSVKASVGDEIDFQFDYVGNHSVVQSTFDKPCTPLPEGFDTTFVPAEAGITMVYQVNSAGPLWFYCRQMIPTNHCHSGMVLAVNPTADQTFEAFQLAANLSGTETTSASSSILSSMTSSSTSTPTTIPTDSGTSESTPSAHPIVHRGIGLGPIIGIAIGGLCGLTFLLLGFFLIHRRRKSKMTTRPAPFFTALEDLEQNESGDSLNHNTAVPLPHSGEITEKTANRLSQVNDVGIEPHRMEEPPSSQDVIPPHTTELIQQMILQTLRREGVIADSENRSDDSPPPTYFTGSDSGR